jgi:ACS family hexuronate transporter-like MFS transporter
MFGALSGMIASLTIGWVLERMNHNYAIILTVAGFMYLIALFIIHLLSPRLRPVELALPAAGQQQQG